MTTDWLITTITHAVIAGQTAFSVAPADDCRGAEACEDGKWSSFYGTWVRKETREQGERRYREVIAPALEGAVEQILCQRLDQSKIAGCVPDQIAFDRKTKKILMGPITSAAAMLGLIPESGLREDVQVGRGFAKPCPKGGPDAIPGRCGPSDDGGRGRGPANECGLGQNHPDYAWMVATIPDALRARARAGDKAAREEICQTLVGTDRASVQRSYEATLRHLLRSRQYCSWAMRTSQQGPVDWDFAMYSHYGTGFSCISGNEGKTRLRVEIFRSMLAKMKRAAKLHR